MQQQQQGNIPHSPDAASGSFPNYGGDPGDDDGEDIKTLDNDDDDDSENDESQTCWRVGALWRRMLSPPTLSNTNEREHDHLEGELMMLRMPFVMVLMVTL